MVVSIPSRGFWFFEGGAIMSLPELLGYVKFQSPRGDFGFFEAELLGYIKLILDAFGFNPLAGILVF